MRRFPVVLAASLALVHVALADEVLFKNGDRLTGEVLSADGGKLTVKTAVAGEVKVDLKDVATFSTDKPIQLNLADGNVIKDQVKPTTQPGTIETAGTGAIRPQPVDLSGVAKINPPPVAWTGSIRAGALLTRGNSDTDSFNFGADATRRTEIDRTTLNAGYLYGREKVPGGDENTTVDNWFAQGKYDYFFAPPKWYAYGIARVERDNIADLELRFSPGVGVGYQWIETPDTKFNTEAGLNWVYEKYEGEDADSHFAARLAYHFDHKFNDKVSIFHNLEFLPSVEDISDYNLNTDVGLRVTLTKNWFSEFKAELRHDETPAAGKLKDDLRYMASLGWLF